MYDIEYHPEVFNDLMALSNEILQETVEYIEKYKNDPYSCSQPLYNQNGRDLRGYRKTYIANATYRIVFNVVNNKLQIVNVIAVGPRDNMQVYNDAFSRKQSH